MANKFETLPVFQEAHSLVLNIYSFTKSFPKEEKFGITSQLRRSAASIAANIVEGNSRIHKGELINFFSIARGSLEETKYFLLLSHDLGYLDENEYQTAFIKTELIGKQLSGLLNYWQTKK